MTDPRRRLRVVTEAAYATDGSAVVTVATPHEEPSGLAQPPGGEPGLDAEPGATLPTDAEEARRSLGSDDWTPPEGPTRGHRWGTPVLLAVRLGVVVLVLAVAATVTIVVTRPSAPAHQPELAWPEPPQDWVGAEPGAGQPEAGSNAGRDDADPAPSAETAPGAGTEPGAGAGADPDSAGGPENGEDPQSAGSVHLVVHVAGAVHTPGIVELPDLARVHEAITAAGGATEEADLTALNLAASVQDGQQIYVPEIGEEPRANPPDGGAPGGSAGTGGASDPATSDGVGGAVVNLNSASATDLQTLPGIGPAMADRILAHRDQHGPFGSVDDLLAVSGIGPATMQRLRDQVTV